MINLRDVLATTIPILFYSLVPFVMYVNRLLSKQRNGNAPYNDKTIDIIAFKLQPVLLWLGFALYVIYDQMKLGNQLGVMYMVAIYGLIINMIYHSTFSNIKNFNNPPLK